MLFSEIKAANMVPESADSVTLREQGQSLCDSFDAYEAEEWDSCGLHFDLTSEGECDMVVDAHLDAQAAADVYVSVVEEAYYLMFAAMDDWGDASDVNYYVELGSRSVSCDERRWRDLSEKERHMAVQRVARNLQEVVLGNFAGTMNFVLYQHYGIDIDEEAEDYDVLSDVSVLTQNEEFVKLATCRFCQLLSKAVDTVLASLYGDWVDNIGEKGLIDESQPPEFVANLDEFSNIIEAYDVKVG